MNTKASAKGWLNRTVDVLFMAALPVLQLCAAETGSVAKASDDYFKPLLASGRITAAACVIVDGDNPPVVKLYGPVSSQSTLWRVASVSKVFTAIAIMQLAQQGKLQLEGIASLLTNLRPAGRAISGTSWRQRAGMGGNSWIRIRNLIRGHIIWHH